MLKTNPLDAEAELVLNFPVPDLEKLPLILNSFPVTVVAPTSTIDVLVLVVVKSVVWKIPFPLALVLSTDSKFMDDVPEVVVLPVTVTVAAAPFIVLFNKLKIAALEKVAFPVKFIVIALEVALDVT